MQFEVSESNYDNIIIDDPIIDDPIINDTAFDKDNSSPSGEDWIINDPVSDFDNNDATSGGGYVRIITAGAAVVAVGAAAALKLAMQPKSECAPHLRKAGARHVCSTAESITQLRKWLKTNTADPVEVVEAAKEHTGCDSESCLYKKIQVLNKDDLGDRFAAQGPWNSTTWLSNDHIDQVLEQWRIKFPKFYHVPFQMRDFAKTGGELTRVNWREVAGEYTSLGCILNTDTSRGTGEHWVAFYVDFVNRTVEYFDSAGHKPHPEFSSFVVDTAHRLSEVTGKRYTDQLVTRVEHQQGNTECGVYSLYYIISRLNGVPYKAFEYGKIDDNMMVEFRKLLFRHS